MTANERLNRLAGWANTEWREHILPYWYTTVDPRGGLAGQVADDGTPDLTAPKGLVMHARHLWSSSTAWMERKNPLDRRIADTALRFLTGPLSDRDAGGFWWTVDDQGRPTTRNKVLYGQAFAIYGLAQYARATGDRPALDRALATFALVEAVGRDRVHGGYYEAVDEHWKHPVAQALSDVDVACDKSMNTNLHVLEAYTVLYLASGLPEVREALEALLAVFERHILVTPEHLGLYFDERWTNLTGHVSFGHDIEASWLMTEAAQALYGADLPAEKRAMPLAIARRTLEVLAENGGSLPNERLDGHLDTDRIWWVQAEALVGLVNAWELTGDETWLGAAEALWAWIENHQIDRVHGEWFWAVSADGVPDRTRPKGGLWKTSYHNGRACFELIHRARRNP